MGEAKRRRERGEMMSEEEQRRLNQEKKIKRRSHVGVGAESMAGAVVAALIASVTRRP